MSDFNEAPVLLETSRAGIAYVLLNRPEKHNAFNADIIAQLADVFETLRGADGVRAMFLAAKGGSFSAGGDIDWMRAAGRYTEAENEEDALALAEMLRKLYTLPMLTVALVNGAAMGGALGLIAACDVAVAVKTAKMRFSEVRLGLTPATISPYVVEAIGPRQARALFATGELFDAAHAEKIGLVHYAVEDAAELAAMAEKLADLAMHAAPGAVEDAKRLVRDVAGRPIDHSLSALTAKRIAARRASDEGREGLTAFLEKRRPSWLSD